MPLQILHIITAFLQIINSPSPAIITRLVSAPICCRSHQLSQSSSSSSSSNLQQPVSPTYCRPALSHACAPNVRGRSFRHADERRHGSRNRLKPCAQLQALKVRRVIKEAGMCRCSSCRAITSSKAAASEQRKQKHTEGSMSQLRMCRNTLQWYDDVS